jgi:DNA invertase Pin-like site-specific DNA recombinase
MLFSPRSPSSTIRILSSAVDVPEADITFLQMAAVVGEWGARRTSERTKAALAAAKERGALLGWSIRSRVGEQQVAAQRGADANRNKAL